MKNKEVYIYGTGSYSKRLAIELKKQDIQVAGYLDSNRTIQFHQGKKVYSLDELTLKRHQSFFIIIGSSFYSEISGMLSSYNLVEYRDYCSGDFFIPNFYTEISYSQYAEDLLVESILNKFLGNKDEGFYIDIGAYHPYKFSNTYKLYLNGWRGINVEPTPNKVELFDILRPRDININAGVSFKKSVMDFYIYRENAFNTTDYKLVQQRISEKDLHYSKKKQIEFLTLQNIVDTYVNVNEINFLNIDVEGHEMDVLNSYKWRIKPHIIAIEMFDIEDNNIKEFLESKNYRLVAKSIATGIFVLNELL